MELFVTQTNKLFNYALSSVANDLTAIADHRDRVFLANSSSLPE